MEGLAAERIGKCGEHDVDGVLGSCQTGVERTHKEKSGIGGKAFAGAKSSHVFRGCVR